MAHFDLAIIGTGSGNSLVTPDFDGKRVAIIESGTFGGTCLNVGCIPTKMYVYAADVANTVAHAARYGIDATLNGVRWPDLRDRVFGRIDPISEGGRDWRVNGPNTTAFLGRATFIGPRRLRIDAGTGAADEITADQIVIAAGSHPTVPGTVSESGVPFHTSETVMRLDALPKRLLVLGSGFIAAEFAHIFSALGSQVTVVARGNTLLRHLDADISARFTAIAQEQWDVRLNTTLTKVNGSQGSGNGDESEVRLDFADGSHATGDILLVATGRAPNTVGLGLEVAGIATREDGGVKVDAHGRTNVEGVWALGDVSSAHQLKHVANHEARRVKHNLLQDWDDVEALMPSDHRYVPSAVFTDPQIASVGLTENQARAKGFNIRTKVQDFGDVAYGWAMEDTTGIAKIVVDDDSGLILGAHIMGHQASSLIQPLIQAMSFDLHAQDVARGQYWIHPALPEVIENALLALCGEPPWPPSRRH